MADYTPVYTPGTAITLTASASIVGGQLVEVSGNGTAAPTPASATPSLKVVGVAAFDAAAGARVTIHGRGQVHETTANGAVTAGDQLVSGAVAGTVKSLAAVGAAPAQADVNNARAVIGIAITSAADAALVRWMEV
jgi:hypothetical protein